MKIAIFLVMAALLAWALGGTLWPKPVVAEFESVTAGDFEWFWSVRVGGNRVRTDRRNNRPQWTMRVQPVNGEAAAFPKEDKPAVFLRIAEPVVVGDRIAFAGELADLPAWARWDSSGQSRWVLFIARDRDRYDAHPMPDRLAVEQQLARLTAGLSVQDEQTILAQRSRVLDPLEHAAE